MTGLALLDPHGGPHASRLDLEAAWITWYAGAPPNTKRARLGDLRHLARWLSSRGAPLREDDPKGVAMRLAEISPGEARAIAAAWTDCMRVQDLTGSTIARRISTISSWLRELAEHGLDWQVRLPRPSIEPYQIHACSWATVERVIEELRSERRVRELAAVLLLAHIGVRRSEACYPKLRAADVQAGDPPKLRITRKGGWIEQRTIAADTHAVLAELLDGRERGPVLVSAIGRPLTDNGLAEMTMRLGLGMPHELRHAGATELYQRTHDLELVRDWLGHRDMSSTQVYIRTLEDSAGKATRILAGE